MPILFLLLLFLPIFAETVEKFTLADGRVLIGQYDPDNRKMTVFNGSTKVIIHVHPLDIKFREPTELPKVAEKPEPKTAEPEAKKKPVMAGSPLTKLRSEFEEAQMKVKELEDKIASVKVDFYKKNRPLIMSLEELDIPFIKDPRKSEVERSYKMTAYNKIIGELKETYTENGREYGAHNLYSELASEKSLNSAEELLEDIQKQ